MLHDPLIAHIAGVAIGTLLGWTLRAIWRIQALRPRTFGLPVHVHVHGDHEGDPKVVYTLERGEQILLGVDTEHTHD